MALTEVDAPLSDATIGEVLTAMSSGERLWYRFGALVAWKLEKEAGRSRLVSSIANPNEFLAVADSMLSST